MAISAAPGKGRELDGEEHLWRGPVDDGTAETASDEGHALDVAHADVGQDEQEGDQRHPTLTGRQGTEKVAHRGRRDKVERVKAKVGQRHRQAGHECKHMARACGGQLAVEDGERVDQRQTRQVAHHHGLDLKLVRQHNLGVLPPLHRTEKPGFHSSCCAASCVVLCCASPGKPSFSFFFFFMKMKNRFISCKMIG